MRPYRFSGFGVNRKQIAIDGAAIQHTIRVSYTAVHPDGVNFQLFFLMMMAPFQLTGFGVDGQGVGRCREIK